MLFLVEAVSPEKTYVGICLMIVFAVKAFEGMRT